MNILKITAIAVILFTSCKKDEVENPPQNPPVNPVTTVPQAAAGQWLHGTFAMSNFWAYDGTYMGNPFSQSVAFDFKSNGTYEMYYTGETNTGSCITDAFSYYQGTVEFTDSSFTTHPVQGRFRGYYTCSPSSNFDRPADSSELNDQTYYYHFETDVNNVEWMVVGFTPNDLYPSYFKKTSW